MRETLILETKNVGLYTWREGGGGLKKCTVCTLMQMLTFLDGPLVLFMFYYMTLIFALMVLLVILLVTTITILYNRTILVIPT